MTFFSDLKYKVKDEEDLWFEELYFNRWFEDVKGPILDIGCATGNFMMVKPEIFEGIEIEDDSYKVAKSRGLKVFKLDVEKDLGGLASAKYEAVYAKQVIEHLKNPLIFLKEIKRILKPGGKAIVLTPNCPFMLKFFWDDYTHQRPFTRKSLKMLAYNAGFKKIKIYEDFRCFPGIGKVMRIFHLKPNTVRFFQTILGIRGYALILEVINN
ncbi:MAG: class I SAM-dependent methyltransferase [Candidatus Zambryskibacteria bacterium]